MMYWHVIDKFWFVFLCTILLAPYKFRNISYIGSGWGVFLY